MLLVVVVFRVIFNFFGFPVVSVPVFLTGAVYDI